MAYQVTGNGIYATKALFEMMSDMVIPMERLHDPPPRPTRDRCRMDLARTDGKATGQGNGAFELLGGCDHPDPSLG